MTSTSTRTSISENSREEEKNSLHPSHVNVDQKSIKGARLVPSESLNTSLSLSHLSSETETKRDHSNIRSCFISLTCTLGMVINTSSISCTNVALKVIAKEFNVQPAILEWLVTAFSLSSGCLLILFGRLADLYGRRLIFLSGLACTAIFSLACGFASSATTLIVLRATQGIGPAALVPAAVGILTHRFQTGSKARSWAFASFGAGGPAGGAIGYQLGGLMTQLTKNTWRSIFYLTAGLCSAVFVLGFISIEKDEPEDLRLEDRRVDWFGAFLVTAGLAMLLFVLGDGTVAVDAWRTNYIIALLILSIILIASFAIWQHYLEFYTTFPPLMKLSIFARGKGRMAVINMIAFFEWCGFQAWALWATLYYQQYLNLSPIATMLRFLPMMIMGVICCFAVGLIVGKVQLHYLIAFGCLATSTAPILFALIDISKPYWAFGFPASITVVVGADFVFSGGSVYVAKLAHPTEQSLAGGLFQTVRQLGTAFGLTITTMIYNVVVKHRMVMNSERTGMMNDPSDPGREAEALLGGFRAAQWGTFGFPILAAMLALGFLRGSGIIGHRGGRTEVRRTDIEALPTIKTVECTSTS